MIKKIDKNFLLNFTIIVTAIIATVGINIDLDKNLSYFDSFDGNNFIYVVLCIFYIYVLKRVFLKTDNKRLIIIVTLISFLLTLFEIVGHTIYVYTDLSGIFYSKSVFVKNIIKAFAIFVTLYTIISLVYIDIISKFTSSIYKKKEKKILYFLINWGIILLCYIPYLLTYYPGFLSYDSLVQMQQGLGMEQITAHHPILHTFIITLCIKIGLAIKGSYSFGAAIYSLLQLIFMSGTFAYALYYMKKYNINKFVRIITFIFFAFYPVMPMYGITMWKDVPFALCMLLYTIFLVEIVYNKENFLKSKIKNILFIVCILLVELFRNNGIYVIMISLPFVILFNKKYWKKILFVFLIPIIVYKIINGPLLTVFNIEEGSIREALSIPLQQLARVEINKGDKLTEEEYTLIHTFIKCEDIKANYKTWLSDPIKEKLDVEYFNNNKLQFVKLWLKLFVKYPIQYFEAFFDNSVGYWYPEIDYMIVTRNIWHFEDGILIESNSLIDGKLIKFVDSFIDRRNIPLITMVFSIGFNVWILFIGMGYIFYKKNYRMVLAYIPMLSLWITVLASPLFAEYRYIFSLFTCLPLLIGFTCEKE